MQLYAPSGLGADFVNYYSTSGPERESLCREAVILPPVTHFSGVSKGKRRDRRCTPCRPLRARSSAVRPRRSCHF